MLPRPGSELVRSGEQARSRSSRFEAGLPVMGTADELARELHAARLRDPLSRVGAADSALRWPVYGAPRVHLGASLLRDDGSEASRPWSHDVATHEDEITPDELDATLEDAETLETERPPGGVAVRLYVSVGPATLSELERRAAAAARSSTRLRLMRSARRASGLSESRRIARAPCT
jgi:hypothetical protein